MVNSLCDSSTLSVLPNVLLEILLIIHSAPVSFIKSKFLITDVAHLNFDFHILKYDMQIMRYASVFAT